MNKRIRIAALAAALGFAAGAAYAQQTVNMPIVIELSGAGAVSGTNFRDGAVLAIDEINARGASSGARSAPPQSDTQSNPGVSRAQVQKAIDGNPYVILGPVFSGSVKVNMILAQQAEVPQFTGAEAADITQMGNAYIFRTSFGQQMSMPKIANYIRDSLKAKTVAVVWVNNDFARRARHLHEGDGGAQHQGGGRHLDRVGPGRLRRRRREGQRRERRCDLRLHERRGERPVPARSAQAGRQQAAHRRDDAARAEGDRAGGRCGQRRERHVGLTVDAPVAAVLAFREKFFKRFNYLPDHNGIKGYTAVYAIKHATEKIGKFDRKLLAKTMHGLTIKPEQEPGILMEATWDDKGDIDRISFLAEVIDGKQKVTQILPKLGK